MCVCMYFAVRYLVDMPMPLIFSDLAKALCCRVSDCKQWLCHRIDLVPYVVRQSFHLYSVRSSAIRWATTQLHRAKGTLILAMCHLLCVPEICLSFVCSLVLLLSYFRLCLVLVVFACLRRLFCLPPVQYTVQHRLRNLLMNIGLSYHENIDHPSSGCGSADELPKSACTL